MSPVFIYRPDPLRRGHARPLGAVRKTVPPDELMARIPGWDAGYYAKAAHRAESMTAADIYGWIEVAYSGMYKAMADYRRDGQPESLDEMTEGLTAAFALLEELKIRGRRRQAGRTA